jgi:DnaJ-class molecular chaperone
MAASTPIDGVAVSERTHYDILDITPTASLDEIKKAFRKRALATHPGMPHHTRYIISYHHIQAI